MAMNLYGEGIEGYGLKVLFGYQDDMDINYQIDRLWDYWETNLWACV